MRAGTLIFLLLILTGCRDESPVAQTRYFSAPDYFKNECKLLNTSHMTLLKKVNYGGKEEMMQIQQPEWEKEIRPFLDCDLNKPAYAGAYTIDTAFTTGAYTIHYSAKERSLPIRKVSLTFQEDRLHSVYMETGKSNAWFKLKQEMTYTPGEGYRISGEQKMAIGKETKFIIAGRFIAPENSPEK